jgi:hypothetical protein
MVNPEGLFMTPAASIHVPGQFMAKPILARQRNSIIREKLWLFCVFSSSVAFGDTFPKSWGRLLVRGGLASPVQGEVGEHGEPGGVVHDACGVNSCPWTIHGEANSCAPAQFIDNPSVSLAPLRLPPLLTQGRHMCDRQARFVKTRFS